MNTFKDFTLDVSSFNNPFGFEIDKTPIIKNNFPDMPFGDPIRLGDAQIDKNVLFTPITSVKSAAKTIKVSGVVVDTTGMPLINASVHIVSGDAFQVGTTTDFDGNFSIKAQPTDTLEVNFLGYKPQRFSAKNVPNVITLQQSIEQLDEIVIDLRKPTATDVTAAAASKGSFLDNITKKQVLTYGGIGLGVLALGFLVFSNPKKATAKAGLKGVKKTIHVTL
jgi:hypothetical protein